MASHPFDSRSSDIEPLQLAPPPARAAIDPAYEIRDDRILDIVAAHPDVAALLDEIAARTPDYFPEVTGLVIRSQTDPEDGSLSWYVEVETPQSAEPVLEQLRRFDRDWWLTAKRDVTPEFVVTTLLV